MRNKGWRNEITKRKWNQRCKNYGVPMGDKVLKHQGKPCSCSACSPVVEKDKHKVKHKQKYLDD